MRGRQAVAWCVAGGLALAGCGGDDGPTAAEKRAAKQRWVERVDSACAKMNDAIADRGWPVNLVDLDRLVVRGVADARAASRTITSLRLPEGSGPEPRAFVAELRKLGPALEELSAASEELEPDALLEVADTLKPRLSALAERAEAAGLSECASNEERILIPDGVRGPVFAEQLAKLERSLFRRLEKLTDTPVRTLQAVAERYEKIGVLVDDNVEGLDTLEPPQWAARQTSAYKDVLLDFKTLVGEAQTLFDQGAGAITRGKLSRLERDFMRLSKRERKARRKMLRAVGAAPTTRGAPDEAPAGDEEQIQS